MFIMNTMSKLSNTVELNVITVLIIMSIILLSLFLISRIQRLQSLLLIVESPAGRPYKKKGKRR